MQKHNARRAAVAASHPRRVWPERLFFALLVLAGVAITLVPVGETFVNNSQGVGPTRDYVAAIAAAPDASLAKALASAEAYNAALKPETLTDPWEERGPVGTAEHDAYLAQLADQEVFGRLRIPQIKVDLPIRHDAGRHELSLGIGHMFGSSLPVGGAGTNSVLAGHTGSRARVFLDRLTEMEMGQTFFVDVYGRTLTYKVTKMTIVTRYDLAAVAVVPGQDLVTLVTCTPDSRRLLVVGTRVPGSGATAGATASGTTNQTTNASDVPVTFDDSIQGWMVPRLGLAGGGLALFAVVVLSWIIGDRRRRRTAAAQPPTPVIAAASDEAADRPEPEEALV